MDAERELRRTYGENIHMKRKRGFLRLWLLISVLWAAGEFYFVWQSCSPLDPGSSVHESAPQTGKPSSEEILCRTVPFKQHYEKLAVAGSFDAEDYIRIALSALSVPLALLLVGSATTWVLRGFTGNELRK
jgi:hypothetical protein